VYKNFIAGTKISVQREAGQRQMTKLLRH